jgi:hypothetical protein
VLRAVGFFLREVEIRVEIARLGRERFSGVNAFFKLLALLQDGLGLFLVLPEIWIVYFLFACGELLLRGFDVKDSSARARCASGARRSVSAGLRCVQPCLNPTQETGK